MARSLCEERMNARNVAIIQPSVISDQPEMFKVTLWTVRW